MNRPPLPTPVAAEVLVPAAVTSTRGDLPAVRRDVLTPARARRPRRPLAFRVTGPTIAPPVATRDRDALLARGDLGGLWACHYCRGLVAESSWVHVDHVVARRGRFERGSSLPRNYVLACRRCNSRKGARPVEWLVARLREEGLPW